jgi:hypothetical protein
MEGTDYLIHPVGDLRVYEGKARYGSSSVIDLSFTISIMEKMRFTVICKLKISKTDSDSIRPLTNKPALIQTATYLKSVSDRAKKTIMVYTMFDTDTNRDGN